MVVGLEGAVFQVDTDDAAATRGDGTDRRREAYAAAATRHRRRHALIHDACSAVRIRELVDEGLVRVAATAEKRVLHGFEKRQLLDPLGGEVGVELGTGDAPK